MLYALAIFAPLAGALVSGLLGRIIGDKYAMGASILGMVVAAPENASGGGEQARNAKQDQDFFHKFKFTTETDWPATGFASWAAGHFPHGYRRSRGGLLSPPPAIRRKYKA